MVNKDNANGLSAFDAEHDEVWSNLPWFVNRTLDSQEHAETQAPLSICLVCRRELVGLRALHEMMSA